MSEQPDNDWRLQGQERYLLGLEFQNSAYASTPGNDHDHCEFCGMKFSVTIPDALKHGYSTRDNYRWICSPCFADFKDRFKWRIVS